MTYHYASSTNQPVGPVTTEQLQALNQAGIVNLDTHILPEGATAWLPYRELFPETEKPRKSRSSMPVIPPALPQKVPWYKRRRLHIFLFLMTPYLEVPLMWILGVFKIPTRIILTLIGCILSLVYFVSPLVLPPLAEPATSRVENPQQTSAQNGPKNPISGTPQKSSPEITWDEINSIYNLNSGKTELQKKEAWKRFKGKRVSWSGTVSEVGETFGIIQLSVKMNADTLTSDVQVTLKPSERQKAANLKENDMVRFTGILDDWGTILDVTLTEGEILVNQPQ